MVSAMSDRLIKFFTPMVIPGSVTPVGLAEFLLQNALNCPDAFSSSEGCDLVQLLHGKLNALKGNAQEGQSIRLSQGQWEMLRAWASPKTPVQWELSAVVSQCMRALHNAEQATEKT